MIQKIGQDLHREFVRLHSKELMALAFPHDCGVNGAHHHVETGIRHQNLMAAEIIFDRFYERLILSPVKLAAKQEFQVITAPIRMSLYFIFDQVKNGKSDLFFIVHDPGLVPFQNEDA